MDAINLQPLNNGHRWTRTVHWRMPAFRMFYEGINEQKLCGLSPQLHWRALTGVSGDVYRLLSCDNFYSGAGGVKEPRLDYGPKHRPLDALEVELAVYAVVSKGNGARARYVTSIVATSV